MPGVQDSDYAFDSGGNFLKALLEIEKTSCAVKDVIAIEPITCVVMDRKSKITVDRVADVETTFNSLRHGCCDIV